MRLVESIQQKKFFLRVNLHGNKINNFEHLKLLMILTELEDYQLEDFNYGGRMYPQIIKMYKIQEVDNGIILGDKFPREERKEMVINAIRLYYKDLDSYDHDKTIMILRMINIIDQILTISPSSGWRAEYISLKILGEIRIDVRDKFNLCNLICKINVFPVTIYDFILIYRRKIDIDDVKLEKCVLLSLISMLSLKIYHYLPSVVALAIIMIVIDHIDVYDNTITRILDEYLNSTMETISRCINLISKTYKKYINFIEELSSVNTILGGNFRWYRSGDPFAEDGEKLNIEKCRFFNEPGEQLDVLGSGEFGEVSKYKIYENIYAQKIFNGETRVMIDELKMSTIIDSKFVGVVRGFNENGDLYYDLSDYDLKYYMSTSKIPRDLVAIFATQLICGILRCHENMVVHCDIKPANILLNSDGSLKIADFGVAQKTNFNSRKMIGCSDIYYKSPECIENQQKRLRQKIRLLPFADDIWAIGCVILEMIIGHVFFNYENVNDKGLQSMRQLVDIKSKLELIHKYGLKHFIPDITTTENSFILSLIEYSPMDRSTAKEAFNHPYISVPYNEYFQGEY